MRDDCWTKSRRYRKRLQQSHKSRNIRVARPNNQGNKYVGCQDQTGYLRYSRDMTLQEMKLGDVIKVLFADKYALCKTIYLSSIVKDVFGFVVLGRCFERDEEPQVESVPILEFELGIGRVKVLYADRKNVETDGIWTVVGSIPVSEEDQSFLLHGVGGTLFNGNDPVREFTSIAERKSFPQILTYGNKAIETVLEHGFKQANLM